MLRVISLFCLVLCSYSASAPFIKPCKINDSACLMSTARENLPIFVQGHPELGIKTLDPMHIASIKSDQGGLKLEFKDSTFRGLKNCNIENIKNDLSKLKQVLMVKCNLVVTGDYNLDGKLLILPIKGTGKYKIDIRDIVIKTTLELATVTGADGKPHWHINKWHQSFKVLTGTRFDFENLFNGDKTLAQPVIEFANENWKDVMQEIAPPVVQVAVSEVVDAVQALYKAVPTDELYYV